MEAFSTQGNGTMTIVKEKSPTDFEVEQNLKTWPSNGAARSRSTARRAICSPWQRSRAAGAEGRAAGRQAAECHDSEVPLRSSWSAPWAAFRRRRKRNR